MKDSIHDKSQATLKHWAELATKQMRGKPPRDLNWVTDEGITVKPLYTAADIESLPYNDTMPGISPYLRGPQATMYAGPALDHSPVRGFFHRRGVQCLLSPVPGGGRAGHFGGL